MTVEESERIAEEWLKVVLTERRQLRSKFTRASLASQFRKVAMDAEAGVYERILFLTKTEKKS